MKNNVVYLFELVKITHLSSLNMLKSKNPRFQDLKIIINKKLVVIKMVL